MFSLLRKSNELNAVLATSRNSFRSVLVFSLIINLLGLVPALYMMQVYDRVMASRSESTLVLLTVIVIGLFTVAALLEAARTYVLVRIGTQFDTQLNRRLFTASFMQQIQTGRGNASQALRDLTNLRQFITGQGVLAFLDLPWVPVYLAVITLMHPLLGLLAVVGALVSIWLGYMNNRAGEKLLNDASALASRSGQVADDNLRNAEVVEAMGMLGSLTSRWRVDHLKFLLLQSQASDKAGIWISASKYFRIFLQSAALGLGAYLALEQSISQGMMIAASILVGKALQPMDQLISSYRQFTSAQIAYKRLDELLESSPVQTEGLPLPAPQGHIEFEQVSSAPPGQPTPILKRANFALPAGRIVGIIGPSGAGKSTLVRTLMGIWQPLEGVVRIDGADIRSWDKGRLGPHLGYLPQEVDLFAGTVAENIARFAPINPEQVIKAAQDTGVHDMILRLPSGYDTPIGPNGQGLSGGQRQRIALARALYGDPALVVLDEPNSSLDDTGVQALMKAVNSVRARGGSVVLVTHRMDILQHTDSVVFMREGFIEAIGPVNDVLAHVQKRAQASANQITTANQGNKVSQESSSGESKNGV